MLDFFVYLEEMTEKSFKQAERDYELDTLLTWSNEDFDEKISKMKTVVRFLFLMVSEIIKTLIFRYICIYSYVYICIYIYIRNAEKEKTDSLLL